MGEVDHPSGTTDRFHENGGPPMQQRSPAFRVCAKCCRRSHQLALIAADEVHGLCTSCVASMRATDADPLEYLQHRLPRVQRDARTPIHGRVVPWSFPRHEPMQDGATGERDTHVEGEGA
jgi:hypothetical protein